MKNLIGKTRKNQKVTREAALAIRDDYTKGMTWKSISEKYKISMTLVGRILKGIHSTLKSLGETHGDFSGIEVSEVSEEAEEAEEAERSEGLPASGTRRHLSATSLGETVKGE